MREVLHRLYSSYGKFWITGLISDVKFSFLQRFLSFYFIPEILIFLCVVEFSKNVLAFFSKRDLIYSHQSVTEEEVLFWFFSEGNKPFAAERKSSLQKRELLSFWGKSVKRNIIIVIWNVLFLILASISLGCCNENICSQKSETFCRDMVFKFSPNLSNALFVICSIWLFFFNFVAHDLLVLTG